ncbi:hypothetical protein [Paenibacillus woosongensis]|uniref:Uncharacterized protein n=1 Tax=Paenibacillus woosongensis TaxID=307580 RepID=A0ABQ4MZ00_9BACL|nr:hypothetical protein [Paenibacillus woosongensis]GIP61159.1 hypothetical protein J15TS10_49730 [Paenibacillus woosongensis]
MARTKEEVQKELQRLLNETNQNEVEIDDILLEYQGKLLIRKSSMMRIGEGVFEGERFEIWTDSEKYRLNIHHETVSGVNFIYCSGYAGPTEGEMVSLFKKRFGMP